MTVVCHAALVPPQTTVRVPPEPNQCAPSRCPKLSLFNGFEQTFLIGHFAWWGVGPVRLRSGHFGGDWWTPAQVWRAGKRGTGDGGRGRGTGIGERGTVKQSFPQRESARSDPSEQREANKKKASSTRTQIGRLVSRGLDGGLLGTRSRHMQNVRARPRIHLPLHLLRPRIINSSSEPTNRTRLHDSSRSTPRDCQGHGEKAASPALRHPGPQRCPDYTAIKT